MKTVIFLMGLIFSQIVCAEIKTVTIEGYQVEYEILGSGSEIVLLEAGGGGGLADWDDIPMSLSKIATVIRYSRVGNGNSSKPEAMFVVEDYARHLNVLLDQLGINKIIHVAHSYGGSVARVFAAQYPDRVEGLLLIDASSEHDVDIMRAINLEQANKEIEAVKLLDIEGGKNYHIVDFWAKFPLPDYPEINDMPVTVIASVKRHKSPAHLLQSDKGVAMWGEHWKKWADAFPQGRAVLTSKSSHLIPQEEPALVIDEVSKLIKRVSANKSVGSIQK